MCVPDDRFRGTGSNGDDRTIAEATAIRVHLQEDHDHDIPKG